MTRAKLPEAKWTPLTITNPDRRWWQWWKPKRVRNPEALRHFEDNMRLLDEIKWKQP